MNLKLLFGGGLALGTAAAIGGAAKLFDSVIPRQDGVRVDISEMADMDQWEEYKKIITPRKEALLAREHETINMMSRDGLMLRATYFSCGKPTKKIVLALHGYTSNGLGNYAAISKFFFDQGYDMLIPDLRAHGESEGDYSGFGILDRYDCLAWIRLILRRFGADRQIILHGTSMGATTALMTTGFANLPKQVKCVIADCAFTSPYDVFTHILKRDYHLPPFPVMQITDVLCNRAAGYGFRDYSTLDAMKVNDRPIMFVHGANDNFVPTHMSYENYDACKAAKELLVVQNAGHGASYYEDSALYEERLSAFLAKWVEGQKEGSVSV